MAAHKLALVLALCFAVASPQVAIARVLQQAQAPVPLTAQLEADVQTLLSEARSPATAQQVEGGFVRFLARNVQAPVPSAVVSTIDTTAAELVDPKTPEPTQYDIAKGYVVAGGNGKYQALAPTLNPEAKSVYDAWSTAFRIANQQG